MRMVSCGSELTRGFRECPSTPIQPRETLDGHTQDSGTLDSLHTIECGPYARV